MEKDKEKKGDFLDKMIQISEAKDYTGEYESEDGRSGYVMCILAYLGPLVLIPILADRKSKRTRFHSNQGLLLFLSELVYIVLTGFLGSLLLRISFGFMVAVSLFFLLGGVFIGLAVLGILNVLNGKVKDLPVIGKYRMIK